VSGCSDSAKIGPYSGIREEEDEESRTTLKEAVPGSRAPTINEQQQQKQ